MYEREKANLTAEAAPANNDNMFRTPSPKNRMRKKPRNSSVFKTTPSPKTRSRKKPRGSDIFRSPSPARQLRKKPQGSDIFRSPSPARQLRKKPRSASDIFRDNELRFSPTRSSGSRKSPPRVQSSEDDDDDGGFSESSSNILDIDGDSDAFETPPPPRSRKKATTSSSSSLSLSTSRRRVSLSSTKDEEHLRRIRLSHEKNTIEEASKRMEQKLHEIESYGESEIEALVRTRYRHICETSFQNKVQEEETLLRAKLEIQKEEAQEELSIATRRAREMRDEFESAERRAQVLRSELNESELENAVVSLHVGSAQIETEQERERNEEYMARARRAIEQQVQGCAAELVESDAKLERVRGERDEIEHEMCSLKSLSKQKLERVYEEFETAAALQTTQLEHTQKERDKVRCEMIELESVSKKALETMSQEHEKKLEQAKLLEIKEQQKTKATTSQMSIHMMELESRLESQCREVELVALQETSSLRDEILDLRNRNEALSLVSNSNVQSIESEILRKDSERQRKIQREETLFLEIQKHYDEERRVMSEKVQRAQDEASSMSRENVNLSQEVSNALARLGRVDAKRNSLLGEISELKEGNMKLCSEYDTAAQDLGNVRQECMDLQMSLQEEHIRKSDLSVLEEDARRRVNGITNCMNDRVEHIESEMETLRIENARLKRRNAELEAGYVDLETLRSENVRLKRRNAELVKSEYVVIETKQCEKNNNNNSDDDELLILSRNCIQEQRLHLVDRMKILERERERVKQISLHDTTNNIVLVNLSRVLDDQHDRFREAYRAVCDAEICFETCDERDDVKHEISKTRSDLQRTRNDYLSFIRHVRSLMDNVPSNLDDDDDDDEREFVDEKKKRRRSFKRSGRNVTPSLMISAGTAAGQQESKLEPHTPTQRSIQRSIEDWARDRRDAQRIVRRHITWLRRQIGVLHISSSGGDRRSSVAKMRDGIGK